MPQNHKNKIALIDGYGFIFRAFHSLPPLTRSDGTPVGAIYGFTNMIIKLLANLQVSHVAIVFDSGSKTFRNEIYPAYKANRPSCPEELIPQFPIMREVAEALNLPILERVGFEADDLIATVAKQASRNDFDVLIVSSDKDLMQLVDEKVTMYDSLKNKMIGEKEVEEKFFVKPNQVLDVLSLMGDASDNVPGVRGIGPKTAAELINQYQTLDNLFEHLDEIKQEKRRQMLIDGIANAKLSKILITLCETVPVSTNLDDYLLQNIDGRKLVNFLEKQGFRALVAKVRKDFGVVDEVKNDDLFSSSLDKAQITNLKIEAKNSAEISQNLTSNQNDEGAYQQVKITTANHISQIKNLIKDATQNGNLVLDIVVENAQIKAFVLSSLENFTSIKEIFYAPINDEKNIDFAGDLFALKTPKDDEGEIKLVDLMAELDEVLSNELVVKIGYKVKDLTHLYKFNTTKFNFDDVALMAYVLNSSENKTNFDVLVADNLSEEIDQDFSKNYQEIEKNKIPQSFVVEDLKIKFYCFKNYAIGKIYKVLKQRISDENLEKVYFSFEKPLIKVLAKMEKNGIAVDEIRLKELSIYFDGEIKKLTKEIYVLAGEEVNIGSPKQLTHILFEKLNLKTGKKSKKTGAFSTGSEVLEELDLEGHLIAGKILQWRQFSKLKSTYADALQIAINQKTKRIHTTFSNLSTSTGRLSSNNPNLQNIPIRSPEGKKIRNTFIAQKGCKLISADYSQIELRVLAQIAQIDNLKLAFELDKDIHAITAAQVFGVDEALVDEDMRRKAKAINFGIIYGISAFGLAKQLKISRADAAKYIENYFATYPGIQKYMSHYQDLARQNGFVETIIGRKCFIHSINSKNPALKGLAERLAINAPIQGSAADIIKKAMIDFDLVLGQKNLQSKMILQVHDELVVEAPINEVEEVSALLKQTMEKAMEGAIFDIPLKVDIAVSDCWE